MGKSTLPVYDEHERELQREFAQQQQRLTGSPVPNARKYADQALTKDGQPARVKDTGRQILVTDGWRVLYHTPLGDMYCAKDGKFYAHPSGVPSRPFTVEPDPDTLGSPNRVRATGWETVTPEGWRRTYDTADESIGEPHKGYYTKDGIWKRLNDDARVRKVRT